MFPTVTTFEFFVQNANFSANFVQGSAQREMARTLNPKISQQHPESTSDEDANRKGNEEEQDSSTARQRFVRLGA